MLSQQEISDRFEIQDLIFHYADRVDKKQFEALRDIFTEDAHVDYSALGGAVGDLNETIAFLKASLVHGLFPNTQHLNANIQLAVDGDRAKGRVMCFNPMQMTLPDGSSQTFFLGLWYCDEYRRTDSGWRISSRLEEKSWVFNTPDFMKL